MTIKLYYSTDQLSAKNKKTVEIIRLALAWLKNNSLQNPILKWDSENWGEIPADFGRK